MVTSTSSYVSSTSPKSIAIIREEDESRMSRWTKFKKSLKYKCSNLRVEKRPKRIFFTLFFLLLHISSFSQIIHAEIIESSTAKSMSRALLSNYAKNRLNFKNFDKSVHDWSSSLFFSNSSPPNISLDFLQEDDISPLVQNNDRNRRSICKISDFSCAKGKCIPSSKYCDSIDDCNDGLGSDEPIGCTPCNRTYYGEWGSTYSISISSDTVRRGNKYGGGSINSSYEPTPFVCQLTFAAAGDDFGDLVQIMFDSINIGHYSSSVNNGCGEGSLQVAEISRPVSGGHWCGVGSGYAVYYSEMSAIALTLNIGPSSTLNSNESDPTLSPSHKEGEKEIKTDVKGDRTVISSSSSLTWTQLPEFDFKIRYKFIPRHLAVVRFGLHTNLKERGELVPGSYCSRVFDNCHHKSCKIQSPNYPGLYPRNITCYFTIRQREIPSSKRILIQIQQKETHKIQLRSTLGRNSFNLSGEGASGLEGFIAWDECRGTRDSLVIYDGISTNYPILLNLCGGAYIPPITSSGSEVLIAFHATPYGNPLESKAPSPFPISLRGFELDVNVLVVDSASAEYSNTLSNCTFYFVSERNNKGQDNGESWIIGKTGSVSNPKNTLPPATTCRYEFRGSKYESIWVYFVSYLRDDSKDVRGSGGKCSTRLRILDGLDSQNEVLLGSYCDGELPRLCDYKALENNTRSVRACTSNESYISAGSRLIIEQKFTRGTALSPLHYLFRYEFVSRHLGSEPTCNRHYLTSKMRPKGMLRTSENVFDFGKGGRRDLSCLYTIILQEEESISLTLEKSSFGQRTCKTVVDRETGRYSCSYSTPTAPKSQIVLSEYIWTSSNLTAHEHCLCDNSSGKVFHFLGSRVELQFNVEEMESQDSYETFFALFSYEIKKGAGCKKNNHYLKTESGLISLESNTVISGEERDKLASCDTYPWLLEAKEGHSLYLRIPGSSMNNRESNGSLGLRNEILRSCPTTKNRIFIYNESGKLVEKICPITTHQMATKSQTQSVEVYSEDFTKFNSPLHYQPKSQFLIEFVGKELGSYRIHWLEVMSIKMKAAVQAVERDSLRMGEAAQIASGIGWTNGNATERRASSPFNDPLFNSMFEDENELGLKGPKGTNSSILATYSEICEYYCPELAACISEKLWCNGIVDCPSSLVDEKSCDSFWLTLNQLMSPAVYLPLAAALISATLCFSLVLLFLLLKRIIIKKTNKNSSSSASSSLSSRRRGGRRGQLSASQQSSLNIRKMWPHDEDPNS